MNRSKILAILFFSGISQAALAGVTAVGAGARPKGMAEAFVALSDDINAIHYNPAGLAQISSLEAAAEHGQFLRGLTDHSSVEGQYIGLAQPLKSGEWGTAAFAYQYFKGAGFFKDRMLYLSYGRKILPARTPNGGQWFLGATLKQFNRRFERDSYTDNGLNDSGAASGRPDPLFSKNGYSHKAYAVDVGALHQFDAEGKTSVGFSITNLNSPDFSLGGANERAPVVTRAGLAYRPRWGAASLELRNSKRLSSGSDKDVALGLEKIFTLSGFGRMGLQTGYVQGSRDLRSVSLGFSFIFSRMRFDYAFNLPLGFLSEFQGNHHFSFGLRFDPSERNESFSGLPQDNVSPSVAVSPKHPNERSSKMDLEIPPGNYAEFMNRYLALKKGGAPAHERLRLLEELYARYGADVDLSWFSRELSSL